MSSLLAFPKLTIKARRTGSRPTAAWRISHLQHSLEHPSMTLLYSSSQFLDHQTGGHPESPARLVAVTCHLAATELDRKCRRPLWKPVSAERLARVHSPKYTAKVRQLAAHGGGHIEADTVMGEESFTTALFAAGAVCDAVERTLAGEDRQAVCLVRPPG